jgi:hypothetical protein
MPSFSLANRTQSRFESDFSIVPDATTPPVGPYLAYVQRLEAALDCLAVDEARDVAAKYAGELLKDRRATRQIAASELKLDAQNVADGKLAPGEERIAAPLRKYDTEIAKFGWANRAAPRFDGDFEVVRAASYVPGPADEVYLANIEKALAECAADQVGDKNPKDNFSSAVIENRKSLRTALAKVLREDIAICSSGGLTRDATDRVLIMRGRYQGRRNRLTSRLFNVRTVKARDDLKTDADRAIDVQINLMGGLPAPEDVVSSDKRDLFVQIHKTNTVIQTVCRRVIERGERRVGCGDAAAANRARNLLDEYMNKLHGIALIGLEMAYPDVAKLALAELRNEFFALESGRIKNEYVRALGAWAGIAAIVFLALFAAVVVKYPGWAWAQDHKMFLLAACGASIGTWASFSVRQVQFTFDDLILQDDILDPPVRVLFVVALTMTACLLFWTGTINLEIGNLKTASETFKSSGAVAFLIGMFAGFSERSLATAISGRAAAFAKGVASGG